MPPRIIAVANQKGGVGKTTVTYTLGQALADEDFKVLLVDTDPQSSLTITLRVEAEDKSIYEVLGGAEAGKLAFRDIVKPQGNLWLAPSDIALAKSELGFVMRYHRESILKKELAEATGFDFILIDCPPSLGLLTVNALVAASWVIIPTQCEYLALRGIALFYETLELVRDSFNPGLEVLGILPNFVDGRLIHHREVIESLKSRGLPLFETRINRSIRFAEAALKGETILTYDSTNPGAEAYRQLAEEVIEHG